MASPPEIARKNGKLSNGPKTIQGKAIASKNSITHGITRQPALIEGEDLTSFQGILEGLKNQYNPSNPIEWHLVQQCAMFMQRQHRIWAYEAALANLNSIETPPDKYPQFSEKPLIFGEPTEWNIERLEDEKLRLEWVLSFIKDFSNLPSRRSKSFREFYLDLREKLLKEVEELQSQPYAPKLDIDINPLFLKLPKEDQLNKFDRALLWKTRKNSKKAEEEDSDYYWQELETIHFLLQLLDLEGSSNWPINSEDFEELMIKISRRITNIERLIVEINDHHAERNKLIEEREKRLKALTFIDCDRVDILKRYESHSNRQLHLALNKLEELKQKKSDAT